jgi:uncharacterized protein YraI
MRLRSIGRVLLFALLLTNVLVFVPVSYAKQQAIMREERGNSRRVSQNPTIQQTLDTNETVIALAVVNVRSGPGLEYEVVHVIPPGVEAIVMGEPVNQVWRQISFEGVIGYVHDDYIAAPTQEADDRHPRASRITGATSKNSRRVRQKRVLPKEGSAITTNSTNLRNWPSLHSSVQYVVPAGTPVTIIQGPIGGVWMRVNIDGVRGYLHRGYLASDSESDTKRILVDLSEQWLYAYDDEDLVFDAPVSTGKDGFNTPVGTFTTFLKYPLQTMTGMLGGESWLVPDVPYVQYITESGVALHGAYWHDLFGTGERLSHGCINLEVDTAAWLFTWAPLGITVEIRP